MKTLAFLTLTASLSIFAFVAQGCTHADRIIVSGEAIDTVGDQFIVTWEAMNKGYTEGKVTKETYDKWIEFAVKARPLYHEAASGWRAARKVGNAVDEKKWSDAAITIGLELAKFYTSLKEADLLPKGAP